MLVYYLILTVKDYIVMLTMSVWKEVIIPLNVGRRSSTHISIQSPYLQNLNRNIPAYFSSKAWSSGIHLWISVGARVRQEKAGSNQFSAGKVR